MRTKFGYPKISGGADIPNSVSGDWDVLIGHMLGVDHVGHRHGPDHPAMSSKLAQVDDIIREIVDILQNGKDTSDTILFVMVPPLPPKKAKRKKNLNNKGPNTFLGIFNLSSSKRVIWLVDKEGLKIYHYRYFFLKLKKKKQFAIAENYC
jgi:predicted AlkP superfamily pyrophosphatase or phosphodiesterase